VEFQAIRLLNQKIKNITFFTEINIYFFVYLRLGSKTYLTFKISQY
jgi:hypothetical protein